MLRKLHLNIKKQQIYRIIVFCGLFFFSSLAFGLDFERILPEASLYPTEDILKRFDALSKEQKREIFITLFILEHATLENDGIIFIVPDLVIYEENKEVKAKYSNWFLIHIGDDERYLEYEIQCDPSIVRDLRKINYTKYIASGVVIFATGLITGILIK